MGVRQKEQVWKSRTKIGSIDIAMILGSWIIGVFTPRTEQFHGRLPGDVGETNREAGLPSAQDSRASTKIA